MRISARTRYGVRVLTDIAMHRMEEPIPISLLAQRTGISKNFLEKVMLILKRNNLVIPSRGVRGGYSLAREPADIYLSEVFIALEESEPLLLCINCPSDCPYRDYCTGHDVLKFLAEAMLSALASFTLETVAERQAISDKLNFAEGRGGKSSLEAQEN